MKRLWNIFRRRGCKPLAAAGGRTAERYRAFHTLLSHNQAALTAIAVMERLYYEGRPFSLNEVRIQYEALVEAVAGTIYSLQTLSSRPFPALLERADLIDQDLFVNFNPRCRVAGERPVLPLSAVERGMAGLVGAKAANLAALGNDLGLPVPPGFCVTANAFERFLQENRILPIVRQQLSFAGPDDMAALEKAGSRIRKLILAADLPSGIGNEILAAYRELEERTGRGVRIAMRSSAVGEDGEASFAGQYETVLNVTGENILDAYKQVLASKYSARAIAYRLHHGLDDRETPMCVLGLVMIDARSSGVLYTADPSSANPGVIKIDSLWGLGEHLVSGSASPDVFIVDRSTRTIAERRIAPKPSQLAVLGSGGTRLEAVPRDRQLRASLPDETVIQLAVHGLLLEEYFGVPQDVEWAVDQAGRLFLLQSRPLARHDAVPRDEPDHYPDNPVLFAGGAAASPGVSSGLVFVISAGDDLNEVPDDAILVAPTASPDLARVAGRIRGIITDVGSVSSHLASVAREFAIPALVDAGSAGKTLRTGDLVTLHADRALVYRGLVKELEADMRAARKLIFGSPIHQRMRAILDRISPLNLTDPSSPSFSPEACITFHDILRFTHETAVREMFGISADNAMAGAVRLESTLPLRLALVDLGGGLAPGLTTCDRVSPGHVRSLPLQALWQGFAHPGVNWAGTMNIETDTMSGALAASAVAELGPPTGGESYGVVSSDYLNLSARFAYHFATIDALCGDNSNQNYVRLQFAGGAGNYYGRSLRVQLMADILEKLGFEVSLTGDLLDASLSRYDRKTLMEKLDLLGRLLASTRLLDMTLSGQDQLRDLSAAFFRGDYDLLLKQETGRLEGFYVQGGAWSLVYHEGREVIKQDGSRWGRRIASEVTGLIGTVIGSSYGEFLDTIEAYSYFPLAIMKDRIVGNGVISVRVKPIAGKIDRAGGIVFGMKNRDNYFVFRSNALEGNIALFEYVNGRRIERTRGRRQIATGEWHALSVVIRGRSVTGYFNEEKVLEFDAGITLKGFVGLWTKADSVVCFDDLRSGVLH